MHTERTKFSSIQIALLKGIKSQCAIHTKYRCKPDATGVSGYKSKGGRFFSAHFEYPNTDIEINQNICYNKIKQSL